MDAPPPPLPPEDDGERPVGSGIRCINCRYELVGLREDGACPECGEPVLHTLKGALALYATDAALASLHRGSSIVLVCAIPLLPMAFATAASIEIVAHWMTLAMTLAFLFINGAFLWGWWLLTTPVSARSQWTEGDRVRLWVRGMLIVHAVILVCLGVVVFVDEPQSGMPSNTIIWAIVGGLLLHTAAWLATMVVQMLHLARLASLVPDAAMHDRAKLLVWLGPLLVVLGIVLIPPIALAGFVMCWLLVNRFRIAFKRIREEREAFARRPAPEVV